jgi:choline dehydrogenase-like flavoprotein
VTSSHPEPPAGWTDTELAVLAAVAETFVRGDALRRARLAAEALSAVADPAQLTQLRLALRAFESPLVNLALAGRRASFTTMSPAARERYLLGWATSRLGRRRSAFQALRKLLTFLAYADPGTNGGNPLHAAMGYQPDRPPVTTRRTPIRPYRPQADAAAGTEPIVLESDVVVVGSGAGGGLIAADLAAGRSVVVLEAGPFVDESAMPSDELGAYDRLYLDHGLLATWDASVTLLAGAAVGGGTLVNWMTCVDAPPEVRSEWRRAHGLDWVDGPEWDDDAAAIEAELGVAETGRIPPKDEVLVRGALELGWEVAPTRRNARDCARCGSCLFGCRAGAKQSGLRAHLARAAVAGARIVDRATVERVLVERGRAVGVAARLEGDDGLARPLHVRAGQVVIAAGGLRTPAVLARSGVDHPALGRNLRIHPTPVVAGWFPEPIRMWNGPMQGARSLQWLTAEPGRNGYVIESAPGHPGLVALALPWEGTDAHAEMLREAALIAPLVALTRDGGVGRVSLTRAGRVRVDYRLDSTGTATLRHALVSMARIARAAGAQRIVAAGTPAVWHGRRGFATASEPRQFVVFEDRLQAMDFAANRGSVFSAHQLGTARMGADPSSSVCDPGGRVRSDRGALVRSLYVADGSLFPTAIGVNPMVSIMALARRVGRTVLAEGAPRG